MTICKFFMQGTCRFGDNCKFEHIMPRTEHSYTNPQSVLMQNKSGPNVDTAQIVKAVINDMASAERGGQWILSSYAPYKDKGPFPGFEDYCMEEIRWMFYQARSSNTLDQYKQQVQGLLQQAMLKIRALQNPSPEIVNMLRTIYNAVPVNNAQSPQQQQFVGQAGISSIFSGGASQQKSIFGSPPAAGTPSIFGGGGAASSQNIFGSPPNPSVFGAATPSNPPAFGGATTTPQSVFGQSSPVGSSIFGGSSTNKSIFGGGGTEQQTNNSSIFGGSSNSNTNPIFAASQPNLGGAPNPFGGAVQQVQPPANNAFTSPLQIAQPVATAHSNSIFGGTQKQIFAAQPSFPQPPQYEPPKPQITQQQAFNIMQQNSRGGFFSPQAPENSQQAFQHSSNIFGTLVQQQQQQQQLPQPQHQQQQQQVLQQQLQAPQQQVQQQIIANDNPFVHITDANYSKLEDLTDSEKAWFQSEELDINNIPINPPTREMCF